MLASELMNTCFIDIVKKGEVCHPTQRRFTLAEWEHAYAHSEDRSSTAKKLYHAGKWVYAKLENVRAELAAYELTQFDKDKALCMLVADLNRTVKVLANSKLETSSDDIVFAPQLIQWKFDNNVLGVPLDGDSILAISLDGARFPIAHISTNGGKPPRINNEGNERILARVQGSNLLGQYYDSLENLWLEFLWHGWEVVEKEDHFIILPIQDSLAANRAISGYRMQLLLIESVQHVVNVWRRGLPAGTKEALSKIPHVKIQESGKKKSYIIRYGSTGDDSPPISLVHQLLAAETYYEGLLDEHLPRLGDISLRQLMAGWEVLHALGMAQECLLPKETGVFEVQDLLKFAPTIARSDLIGLFKGALSMSNEQANRLLDFFVFSPSPRNELWDAPLVALTGNKYALVLAAALHANLLRIMEKSMIRGGIDISKKGKAFEADCRQRIREAIKKNDLLRTSGVHPTGITLRTANKEEEMDVLLWIGNTFIIAEAKCLLFPSEPLDFRHYYDTIEAAARQAQRKKLFANEHRKELLDELGLRVDPANINLKPLVIVNSPFGAGFTCLDVPVTDPRILELFLRQRQIEHFVMFGPDGKKEFVGSKTELYASEEGAAEAIYEYLCNPPQVEMYKKFLKVAFSSIPKINDNDKPFAVGRYEVSIPQLE